MKKNKEKVNHGFDVYYNHDSKVLILGSMPSVKSRELGFYYMHPKNRFWKVISLVFNSNYPETIDDKKEFLRKNKIALWDVIKECEIHGSSDSSISNVVVNDIKELLPKTSINKIYTTGKKAYELYQKYIYDTTKIEAIYLPSTSPANAVLSESNLVDRYKVIRGETDEINS